VVHLPMAGIRVLEVAQFTFTPAAGAVLTEWGADVIKVEHAETGDAQRGLRIGPYAPAEGSFAPIMDHPNRGKRSIGLAVDTPAGHGVLMDLARSADVFLTNFLPDARRRLKIDVDDLRKVNPNIIYVRGSANGQRGPDAENGGFDGTTFWCRGGSAWSATPPDCPRPISMPGGAYGDTIGGMTIAGGIAAALFAREATGEASVVDVSLLGVGLWSMALNISNALMTGTNIEPPPLTAPVAAVANPFVGLLRTSDDRWLSLAILQPGRYFADTCKHLGLDHLLGDQRFATAEGIMEHTKEIADEVARAIAAQPLAYWLDRLQTLEGQWAALQNQLEAGADPQVLANGYLVDVIDAEGTSRQLVANPVQFDERPPSSARGPLFAEHTDDILRELGKTEDEMIQLKVEGACT
jgi:crotonobetainyl-CoA:carnitine CoA-transferase CaiB-like acyl-CoA transferase